jgi:hypothetical protein
MHGEWAKIDGVTVHICHGSKHALYCQFCHTRPTAKLCDYEIPALDEGKKGRTCDAAMCVECATSVGKNRDYCPKHKVFARQGGLFE